MLFASVVTVSPMAVPHQSRLDDVVLPAQRDGIICRSGRAQIELGLGTIERPTHLRCEIKLRISQVFPAYMLGAIDGRRDSTD
jgi:hypothetical protein